MVSALISRVVILVFGTLYPAYSSYKAVKTKNVKEYVKWMMYWIVFALFTSIETFADVLVSWFPFYYELKIVFVIWLLSPATKGSSVLYRKFVHPELMKREEEIDQTLDKVKTQGYSALVNVGQQGLNFAVQSAMTGQTRMMDHLMKKSLSLNDISQQQSNTGAQQLPFRPPHQIPEEKDETDFSSPHTYPSAPEYDSVQGGEKRDQEKEYVEPHPPAEPRHRSYNLRSHEYHAGDTGFSSSDTHRYNTQEVQDLPSTTYSTESLNVSNLVSDPKPPAKPRSRSRSTGRKRALKAAKPNNNKVIANNTKSQQRKALPQS